MSIAVSNSSVRRFESLLFQDEQRNDAVFGWPGAFERDGQLSEQPQAWTFIEWSLHAEQHDSARQRGEGWNH